MTITAGPCCPKQAPLPPTTAPVRSARTSLILAEAARQRRWERRQRRQGRLRREAWFAGFDRHPFESVRTQATPDIIFTASTPLVFTLPSF